MRPESMKAALLVAHHAPLEIATVPLPAPPKGNQVIVKVDGCGLCHTDLHMVDGMVPGLPPSLPHIMGHEIGGYVFEVGDQVSGYSPGDPVVVWAAGGCGRCSFCISGRDILCTEERKWPGSTIAGGYAQYVLIEHERFLVKIAGVRPRAAAPFTDAAITSYSAVRKALNHTDPEFPVLAFGIGGIGSFGIQYLKLMSGCDIIAVDITQDKRTAALAMGANHALDGNSPTLIEDIMALTDGAGVSAAIDFVGTQTSLDTALAVTRADGAVIQTGMAGGVARVEGSTNPNHWAVAFQFSIGASIKELREVMAMVRSQRIVPLSISYRPIDDVNQAHRDMRENKVDGRIVLVHEE